MASFKHSALFALLLSLSAGLPACGSKDKGEPDPVPPTDITLAVDRSSLWAGEEIFITASFSTGSAEAPTCHWYVDDELGGSETLGTITQDNPALYASPPVAPAGGQVEVKAVRTQDASATGTATLAVRTPEVRLLLPRTQVQLEDTLAIEASLAAAPRGTEKFEWLVDDVLGGSAAVGTITQGNPATYTAPASVPPGGGAQIKARWTVRPEMYHASAELEILFTIKHVDAAAGQDEPSRGRRGLPFRTIGYAVERAATGDTILVAPGVYGPAIGEKSSISVWARKTVRGVDRDACIIEADPSPSSPLRSIFYLGGEAVVENLTIRNPEYPSSQMQHGVAIQGHATVRRVVLREPYILSAVRVMNPDVQAHIEDCDLVNTLAPGEERGMELTGESRATLRNTRIHGWGYGLFINGPRGHRIEGCSFRDNLYGVLTFTSDANPDLGGGAEGSPGGNTFQNRGIGIYNHSAEPVYARENTWSATPPVECGEEGDAPCDFYNPSGGTIVWN